MHESIRFLFRLVTVCTFYNNNIPIILPPPPSLFTINISQWKSFLHSLEHNDGRKDLTAAAAKIITNCLSNTFAFLLPHFITGSNISVRDALSLFVACHCCEAVRTWWVSGIRRLLPTCSARTIDPLATLVPSHVVSFKFYG